MEARRASRPAGSGSGSGSGSRIEAAPARPGARAVRAAPARPLAAGTAASARVRTSRAAPFPGCPSAAVRRAAGAAAAVAG